MFRLFSSHIYQVIFSAMINILSGLGKSIFRFLILYIINITIPRLTSAFLLNHSKSLLRCIYENKAL